MRIILNSVKTVRRSIRFELAVSYLILFLLSLVTWLILQFMSNQVINRMTASSYSDVLKAAATRIDSEVASVLEAARNISTDQTVLLCINNQVPVYGRNAYRNREAVAYLGEYSKKLEIVDGITLYLHDSSRIIASECAASAAVYFDMRYASNLNLNQDEWEAMLRRGYHYEFQEVAGHNGATRLWLLSTLPFSNARKASGQATLVLEMRQNIFDILYRQLNLEGNIGLEMVEPSGKRVFQSSLYPPGERMTTLTQTSSATGWEYILHVPDALIKRNAGFILQRTGLALMILTLGSFLMMIHFVKRHYSPLRTVMRMVETSAGPHAPTEVSGREYVFLQTLINNVVADNRNRRAQLEQYAGALRSAYLSNLLLGNVDARGSSDMLGFDLDSGAFSVLIVQDTRNQGPGLAELSRCLRIGTSEDALFCGAATSINRQAVFLLDCTDMSASDNGAAMARLLSLASDERYVLAGSNMYEGVRGVAEAYREASYRMDYALSSGEPYSMASIVEGDSRLELREVLLSELREALAGSDCDRTGAVLAQLYESNRPACRDNPARARFLTATLLSLVLQTGERAGIPISRTAELDAVWDDYAKTQDYQSMESLVRSTAATLCGLMQEEKRSGSGEMKEAILSWLDEHYADPNLSVEGICRQFGKSSATISRLFRDEAEGGTLNNQIAIRRIARAKQAIVETKGEIQISELCGQVGYGSINTFLRQFKRLEGITPGKFADLARSMNRFRDCE